jgi:hypothetical protein
MDTPESPSENTMELTDEEKANLEKRAKLLVDEANDAFNRFISNFDSLNNKISSLFQIFLVLISIEIVVIFPYFENDFVFTVYSKFLICWVIFWGIISFGLLIYLLCPKQIRDISIFEEKRFNELCTLDSMDLLSDFLYQMKNSYQFVVPIYIKVKNFFYLAFTTVIIMTVSYIILIISLIIK